MRALLVLLLTAGGCSTGSSGEPDGGGLSFFDAAPQPDARRGADAGVDGLDFTFEFDLEGWIADHGPREYDRAVFLPDEGNPGGCVMLDGSDLGAPDGVPNSTLTRVIELPEGVGTMKFDTRAAENGSLRVRLLDAAETEHTLLDWEVLSGPTWVARSADVKDFAGEEVTIIFEQNDNDVGIGEMRYIDNIGIH